MITTPELKPFYPASMLKRHPFSKPPGLSPLGIEAWRIIVRQLLKDYEVGIKDLNRGQHAFYSPQQWRDRQEPYACEDAAELIVLHEGYGGYYAHISMDSIVDRDYTNYNRLFDSLCEKHLVLQEVTMWYSCVYRDS